jgi:drug/metabolite transporter (DMT)-like permease
VSLLLAYAALDAVNVGLLFAAMDVSTVAIAVLTHYLAPVFVALAAPLLERNRVSGAIPAALVAMAGLIAVLQPWDPARLTGSATTGALLGMGSAVAYAASIFVIRRLAPLIGSATTVSAHSALSALLLLPLAGEALVHLDVSAWGRLALGGAIAGAGASWLFLQGMTKIGPSRAAVLAYVEPLVAISIGALIWHEPLGVSAVLGAALIAGAGLWIVQH